MSSEDWLALWSEFDFADPDGAGKRGAAATQLRAAVQTVGEPLDIDRAVREGYLTRETTTDRHGVEKTTRYRLNLAGGMA